MITEIDRRKYREKWRKKNLDYYFKTYIKQYRVIHKDKYVARYRFYNLMYRYKQKYENCAICDSSNNIEAHHENYSIWNCVIFLCQKCHEEMKI